MLSSIPMEKSIKLKLRNAKKLYQDAQFQSSLTLVDEVLSEDVDNYHAIVLKAANCDQLAMEDESADCFWKAIRLDKNNVLAWQGLVQMGSKNMDRFYSTLVCACIVLREFYTSAESGDKQTSNSRLLVELLVHYRLELPLGMTDFRTLCQSVLLTQPDHPYALEALIRLKIEAFLIRGFPYLISPSVVSSESGSDFVKSPTDFCRELIHPETISQLEALQAHLTSAPVHSEQSVSTANTVQLGRLAHLVASWIQSGAAHPDELSDTQEDSNTAPWTRVMEEISEMSLNGYRGVENWYRRDLIDFHAMGLLILATYKSHAFLRCNALIEQVLAYLQAHRDSMHLEARELTELAAVPLSQLTDFITPRPAATPFRLQLDNPPGWSGSLQDCLMELMLGFQLANAAASEDPSIIEHMLRNFAARCNSTHQNSFFWPNTIQTLWLECCLTDKQLDTALNILFPLNTQTSSSTTVESILDLCSSQSDWRTRLCYLWTAVELARQNVTRSEILSDLVDSVIALKESVPEPASARDHYLLGRLISNLDTVPGLCATEARLSQPVQMDQYSVGISVDPTYFANHLSLGRLSRRMGRLKEALESLGQAKKLLPKSPECTYELALALCENNEMQKAFDCYADVKQTHFTKDMWLNYGLVALQLGNTLKGVPALQKVIIMEPQNALYWEILGEAYLLRKSYETAVKTLNRSIQLDPKCPTTHILCGQAYRRLGDTMFAVRHMEQGLEYARQTSLTKPKTAVDIRLLALKELAELNLFLAYSNLRQGLSGQALNQWSSTLQYLAEVFDCCRVGGRSVPVWAFHFLGSAFSLLSVIHDPEMRLSVPRRLVSVLKNRREREPVGSLNPLGSSSVLICQCDCLRLADIYFACAIKSFNLTQHKKRLDSVETDQDSAVLERGSLLIAVGLHSLTHSRYLRRGHSKTCACDMKQADTRAESLLGLTEAVLKRACRELNDAAELDQRFLDSCETEEDVAAVSKINRLETSVQQVVRNRLVTNRDLRSKAWYGLAEMYSFRTGSADTIVDFCLCQALMMNPQNSEAGTSLALRLLHQGRVEIASSLITHFQAADPENYLVWLASAHLHAIISAPEAISRSVRAKHGAAIAHRRSINQPVLQHLLQAACLGANVQVALQLVSQLFPLVLDTLHDHTLPTGLGSDTRSFLRLAIEVTSEALNRALAFEPKNSRLWHNRGILLQLAGLSTPAAYCLKNALAFSEPIERDSPMPARLRHQLLCAHHFLITYICGTPDWSVAEQLIASAGESNPTLCTSMAEALAKGLAFLRHSGPDGPSKLGEHCLTDEVSRLAHQESPAALMSLTLCPTAGAWISLLSALAYTDQNSNIDAQLNKLLHIQQHASRPLFPHPPQLAVRLSQLVVMWITNSSMTASLCYLSHACLDWERAYDAAHSDQWDENTRGTGHVLADFEILDPVQRAIWAESNATLAAILGNGFSSGMAHLSRFVATCPSDPLRWTALGRWLLTHSVQNQPKTKLRGKNSRQTEQQGLNLTDWWPVLLHCVRNAVQLSTLAPSSELLAELLTMCCAEQQQQRPTVDINADGLFLLCCLRRAAALFPQTPGLREQLLQCATSSLV